MVVKEGTAEQHGVFGILINLLMHIVVCLIELPHRLLGCGIDCPKCGEGILVPEDIVATGSVESGINMLNSVATSKVLVCTRCDHKE